VWQLLGPGNDFHIFDGVSSLSVGRMRLLTHLSAAAVDLLPLARPQRILDTHTDVVHLKVVLLQCMGSFAYTIFQSIIQYAFNPDNDPVVCDASALVCIMLYAIMKGVCPTTQAAGNKLQDLYTETLQLLYLFLADRLVRCSSATSRVRSELTVPSTWSEVR